MTARGAVLAIGTACAAVLAAAPAAAAPPGPRAEVLERTEPVLAAARAPADSAWAGAVVVLEGKPDAPDAEAPRLGLLRVRDGRAEVAPLGAAPREARSVACLAGPGPGRLLVGRPGGIDEFVAGPDGLSAVARLEDDRLEPFRLADRPDLDGDGTPDLLQAAYTGLLAWRRTATGFAPLAAARLAPVVRSGAEQVTVSGSDVLVPVPDAPERWSFPDGLPGHRLRLFRVPLGPQGAGTPCAAWIDAGTALRPLAAAVLSGTAPRLVALAAPADKLSFFGNATLVVAPLACDETARGTAPLQAFKTGVDAMIGWTRLDVRDATGDGLPDALLSGHQGLTSPDLHVALHEGTAGGRFAERARECSVRKVTPLGARWDEDVDGDGWFDLVAFEESGAILLRGTAPKAGSVPLACDAPVRVTLPEGVTAQRMLELADIDGDGARELVLAARWSPPGRKEGKTRMEVSREGAVHGDDAPRIVVIHFR